jgi:hypothetical protein
MTQKIFYDLLKGLNYLMNTLLLVRTMAMKA